MADKQDIQNQEELNKRLGQTEGLIDNISMSAHDLTQTLAASVQEISRSNINLNEARKSYRGLLKLTQTIEANQQGITRLSKSELDKLEQKAKIELNRLKSSAELIKQKRENLGLQEELNDQEEAILAAATEGFENEKEVVKLLQEEVKSRAEIENIMGLTGAALENLNRIGIRALGGIGVNLGALQSGFDIAKEAAEEQARIVQAARQEQGRIISRYTVLQATLPGIGAAAQAALVDPLTVSLFSVTKIIQAFNRIQEASVKLGRLTGQNISATAGLNTRFATTVDVIETATELTERLGVSINNLFDSDTLAATAELKNQLGLSSEQAGTLGIITETIKGDVDGTVDSILSQVNAFNKTRRTAISAGIVLREIGELSEDTLASFQNQPAAIAEAVSQAKALGLSLKSVDQVASSLLDFESSIEAELTAQLLTGREINLAKARQASLNNDLVAVGQELFSNSASIYEFANLNRIAQEGQAKALGLSRQELARIAVQRGATLGITNQQLEAVAQLTKEDLERVGIQERFNKSITKLTQALIGPVELMASLADNTAFVYTTLGAIASVSLFKMILQIQSLAVSLATAATGAITLSSAVTLGAAGLAIAAGIGVAYAAYRGMQEDAITNIKDGVISPDKGLIVSGPKGSVQLDREDEVAAGTDLFSKKSTTQNYSKPSKAEKLLERLVQAVEKGGDVYLDSNKVGESLVLTSYKNA